NITDILVKIIKFTQTRKEVLTRNINNIHNSDFVPRDLSVDEFSDLLNNAITEHTLNRRLILCDTDSIKFGPEGSFDVEPVTDTNSAAASGDKVK
ncbi:hypothetical protein LCGC14_2898480, partial [marine sediment metagenome]